MVHNAYVHLLAWVGQILVKPTVGLTSHAQFNMNDRLLLGKAIRALSDSVGHNLCHRFGFEAEQEKASNVTERLKRTIFSFFASGEELTRHSSQVKPISYLKANAAEVLAQLTEQREPLVITQNGEAKAVLQDVASFEKTQETLALLKLLAVGNQDVEAGRIKPVTDVVARLRAKRESA